MTSEGDKQGRQRQVRRNVLILGMLLMTHAACLITTIASHPAVESFGVLFIVWLVLPATVAAIGFAPRLSPVVAAALNGLIAAVMFDVLLLRFSFFWPHQPLAVRIELAAVYLLVGVAVASTCGAFVSSILRAIDSCAESSRPMGAAIRKGTTFAIACVILTTPILVLLLPPGSSTGLVVCAYAGTGLAFGTAVSAITGMTYSQLRDDVGDETPRGEAFR